MGGSESAGKSTAEAAGRERYDDGWQRSVTGYGLLDACGFALVAEPAGGAV